MRYDKKQTSKYNSAPVPQSDNLMVFCLNFFHVQRSHGNFSLNSIRNCRLVVKNKLCTLSELHPSQGIEHSAQGDDFKVFILKYHFPYSSALKCIKVKTITLNWYTVRLKHQLSKGFI